VAFSPKTARPRNTQKDHMFGRQRKDQGQQRYQYEDANKYVFKCRLSYILRHNLIIAASRGLLAIARLCCYQQQEEEKWTHRRQCE